MSKFEWRNNELFEHQTKILDNLNQSIIKNGSNSEKFLKIIAEQFVILNQKTDFLLEQFKEMNQNPKNKKE